MLLLTLLFIEIAKLFVNDGEVGSVVGQGMKKSKKENPQKSLQLSTHTHTSPCIASMERPPLPGFICPITQDIMETPMVGPDGRSYERGAIEEALRHNPTSPITRQPMTVGTLVNNYALRDSIMAWQLEQPMAIDPDRLVLFVPEEVIGRGSFGKVSTRLSESSLLSPQCLLEPAPLDVTQVWQRFK